MTITNIMRDVLVALFFPFGFILIDRWRIYLREGRFRISLISVYFSVIGVLSIMVIFTTNSVDRLREFQANATFAFCVLLIIWYILKYIFSVIKTTKF